MDEIWVDAFGWGDFYQVSNLGRVRSVDRVVYCKNPRGAVSPRKFRGRVLKAGAGGNGYLTVSFTKPGEKRFCVSVHSLVMLSFIGVPPENFEVCHNDGDRTNNRLSNLRYDTRKANAEDRKKHGTNGGLKGEKAAAAKLTDRKVRWIRKHTGGLSMREMGRRLGVCHRTISAVVHGDAWSHV